MSYKYLGSSSAAPGSGSAAGGGSYLALDANNNVILTASAGGGGGVITALNNQAESRLVSIGSTTTELDGEANLTFDGTNLLLGGTGKLYFNDAGGEYIYGTGDNLISVAGSSNTMVAGTNIALVPLDTVVISGSLSSGSLAFFGENGTATYNAISFNYGLAGATKTSWAMTSTSPSFGGPGKVEGVLGFSQYYNKDGNLVNGATGYSHLGIGNSGSVYIGRGATTSPGGAINDFTDDYAYAAYIGTNTANTGGALYASGSVKVKGRISTPLHALGTTGIQTASVDGTLSNMFSLAMTGSQHLANPTNLLPGTSYTFILTQDGTGGRTLSFGTSYLWPGGITGSLSTGANDVDILSAITDGTSLYCSLTKDFS